MGKKIVLPTLSLGSEPGHISPARLAEWIGQQRGQWADLTSYHVESCLLPQVEAGITLPCAGGKFYSTRLGEAIKGLANGRVTGELDLDTQYLGDDAGRARRIAPVCRFAVPAPHILVNTGPSEKDQEEAKFALYQKYSLIFRTMRDDGIAGHVCIGERAVPEEMEALAGKRVLFFVEEGDAATLETILDYQHVIVIKGEEITAVMDLCDRYDIFRVVIRDPRKDDIRALLQVFDQDQVQVAGYGSDCQPEYWKAVAGFATIDV
ncbi:MAG: hypothetical protein NQU46_06820 [Methanolinea sp.]|nr:hypothetical protein [Methanolinea sp.]